MKSNIEANKRISEWANKLIIIIVLILVISQAVFADVYEHPETLENISKQIPKIESIKCKFRQEKYMQNISKPLISSGNFEFVENKGVYFYTLYPVQTTVDYTNKNYRQINDVIKAVSTHRYSKLEKEFGFYFEKNGNKWSFAMLPKKTSNAYDYISSITISGVDYINKITICQTNGNKTVLWFTK